MQLLTNREYVLNVKRRWLGACGLAVSAAFVGGATPATALTADTSSAPGPCDEANVYDVAAVEDARLFTTTGECRSHIAAGGAVETVTGQYANFPDRVSVLWVAEDQCNEEASAAIAASPVGEYEGGPLFYLPRWSPNGYAPFTHYPVAYGVMPKYNRTVWRQALRPLLLTGCVQMWWTGEVGAVERLRTLGLHPEISEE
jgi:hypothetical protein